MDHMRKMTVLLVSVIALFAKEYIVTPQNVSHLSAICKKAHGGDTIYLKGGIYTKLPRKIDCRGGKDHYLHLKAYPGQKPVLKKGLRIKGAWLMIEGLAFEGNNQELGYEDAIRHWWRPTKAMKNFGLFVQGHHIVIKDSVFGNFPMYGLKISGKSDYITIKHNIIYNNAWWSTAGTGGLVIKNIHQRDSSHKRKIHILHNLFFGNESRIISHVFKKGFATMVIDEGYSFLIQERDDASKKGAKRGHYDGIYEAKGNLILFNGKGLSVNKADNVELVANDLFCNGTTASSPQAAGVRVNKDSSDIYIANNAVQTCGDGVAYSVKAKECDSRTTTQKAVSKYRCEASSM